MGAALNGSGASAAPAIAVAAGSIATALNIAPAQPQRISSRPDGGGRFPIMRGRPVMWGAGVSAALRPERGKRGPASADYIRRVSLKRPRWLPVFTSTGLDACAAAARRCASQRHESADHSGLRRSRRAVSFFQEWSALFRDGRATGRAHSVLLSPAAADRRRSGSHRAAARSTRMGDPSAQTFAPCR